MKDGSMYEEKNLIDGIYSPVALRMVRATGGVVLEGGGHVRLNVLV